MISETTAWGLYIEVADVKITASYRHPEFSRSMTSDNWREAKKRNSEMNAGVVSSSYRQDHTTPVKRWRNPPERDEPRGRGRSHRESDGRDSIHYNREDCRLNPMWTSPVGY